MYVKIPYCEKNENVIRKVVKRIESFTNDEVKVVYTWKTTKLRSMFPMKDKIQHHNMAIYKGICSCGEIYIGETKRNVSVRWGEHNSSDEKSQPSKHLVRNPQHQFVWSILSKAPIDWRKRKILEAYYISLEKPSINDQKDIHSLILFRNGIT